MDKVLAIAAVETELNLLKSGGKTYYRFGDKEEGLGSYGYRYFKQGESGGANYKPFCQVDSGHVALLVPSLVTDSEVGGYINGLAISQ